MSVTYTTKEVLAANATSLLIVRIASAATPPANSNTANAFVNQLRFIILVGLSNKVNNGDAELGGIIPDR
jgi:hypothetical protein